MKSKTAILAACALAAVVANGGRSTGVGIDAFNLAVPPGVAQTKAFSPLSFELDACLMADALEPISRANVLEKLGVSTDFGSIYNPILDELGAAPSTNRLFFLSARTIGVYEPGRVNPEFKRRVFDMRMNASISLLWPTRGAERWLKACMDGLMEDFAMPLGKVGIGEYGFVDVAAVVAQLPPDAACVTVEGDFRSGSGDGAKTKFLKFRAKTDYFRSADHTTMRLPLRGGAFLYLVAPGEKGSFVNLRKALDGGALRTFMSEPVDPGEKGSGSTVCEISLPVLDLYSQTGLNHPFAMAGVPEGGVTYLYKDLNRRSSFQCLRFRLEPGDVPEGTEDAAAAKSKAVFNRPFVFFIHVPELDIVPAIGQFTGIE